MDLPEVRDPETGARRCTAHNRFGERCKNAPIRGSNVCRTHGGASPQVKRKAALRLATLVEPAVATLARIMTDTSAKNSDRLRAAENILDRGGVPRRTDAGDPAAARALLIDRLTALRAEREKQETEPIIARLIEQDAPQNDPDTTETT